MSVNYTGCAVRPFAAQEGVCDGCGDGLTGRQRRWCSEACAEADRAEHIWSMARHAAVMRDKRTCTGCGAHGWMVQLEVNHIEPRVGRGYGTGCWNHLSNLETLCHDCHVQVTKAQAASRRGLLVLLQ